MRSPDGPETQYLNVDLDVLSRVPLESLVAAMGPGVLVLHVGRHGRKYGAHVELRASYVDMSPDKAIRGLVRIVERLPVRERRLWDTALSREFNIGIEAGLRPHALEVRLKQSTVEAIVTIGASIVLTVYAPEAAGPVAASTAAAAARGVRGAGAGMRRKHEDTVRHEDGDP